MWTKEAYSVVVVVVVVVVLLLTNVIWCNVKAGDHLHGNNNKQTKTTLMTWMRRCFLCKSSLRLPLRRYNYLLEIDRLIDCIFVSRLFADLCTFCFLWGFSSSLYRSADTQTVLDSKQNTTVCFHVPSTPLNTPVNDLKMTLTVSEIFAAASATISRGPRITASNRPKQDRERKQNFGERYTARIGFKLNVRLPVY